MNLADSTVCLNDDSIKKLQSIFTTIDVNNSGTISQEELIRARKKLAIEVEVKQLNDFMTTHEVCSHACTCYSNTSRGYYSRAASISFRASGGAASIRERRPIESGVWSRQIR